MDFSNLVHAVSWVRWAPVHFLVLGFVLFIVDAAWLSPTEDDSVFMIDAAALARGSAGAAIPLQTAVDDEILYREALRRGLDRGDTVIAQRLVRDMRFLDPGTKRSDAQLYEDAKDLGLDKSDVVVRRRLVERMRRLLLAEAAIPMPSDDELRLHLQKSGDRFDSAPRVRIRHFFFEDPTAAAAMKVRLQEESLPRDEVIGDPFPIASFLPSLSEREISARFGPGFAREVFGLDTNVWDGPVPSAYGFHLVTVEEKTPGRAAKLDAVRARVLGDWRAQREARELEDALNQLRSNYKTFSDP